MCALPQTYGVYSECCNGNVYDRIYKICCGGLQLLRYGESSACCGGWQQYNFTADICCTRKSNKGDFDVLRPRTYGDRTGCCDGEAYDRDEHICCDGRLSGRDFGRNTRCCGASVYNSQIQLCCNGNIETSGLYVSCCGSATYNYSSSVCCSDVVQDRTYGLAILDGTAAYNYRTHACCDGVVALKEFGYASLCCGRSVIDSRNQYCCDGRPYNLGRMCCAGVLRDREFGSESRCCRSAVFNASASTCCGGVLHDVALHDVVSEGYLCCGASILNTESEFCCHDCTTSDCLRSTPSEAQSLDMADNSTTNTANDLEEAVATGPQ